MPMQFMAQIHLADAESSFPDALLLLFMCAEPASLCEVGPPRAAGNRALCVARRDLALASPPEGAGHALRDLEALRLVDLVGSYEEARLKVGPGEFVWGHVGEPAQSVSKHIPQCDQCGRAMRFVVELEQGPNEETAFNFNGVTAFAYACGACLTAVLFIDDFF
jgi:hypothetical protein